MLVVTGHGNIKLVRRYRVTRWESPATGEKGWLVLDHLRSEPQPVDVFPTRKRAQSWIALNTPHPLYRVVRGPHAGITGTVRSIDQGHNVEVTEAK